MEQKLNSIPPYATEAQQRYEDEVSTSSQTIAKPNVICRYYNSGNLLGVIGIQSNNIHHQDGEYTFLTGREPDYQWIMSSDLYDTYEEAKAAKPARFFNGI